MLDINKQVAKEVRGLANTLEISDLCALIQAMEEKCVNCSNSNRKSRMWQEMGILLHVLWTRDMSAWSVMMKPKHLRRSVSVK